MIIAPISAIPSWEGFEYQRHIALYMALKWIWEEVNADKEENIASYKLGIEGEEDFSIIKGDKYVSLHQVKEGEVRLKSDDKACFLISKLQYGAENAYFHINPSETIPPDFVEKTVKNIDSLIRAFEKEVKTMEEFLDEIKELEESEEIELKKDSTLYKQTEDKYILIDNITYNKPKGSMYKILDFGCSGNKEKDNVIKVVCNVSTELKRYKDTLDSKNDSDMWEVYNDRFDTPAAVIIKSCGIIEKILKKMNPEGEMYYREDYYQFVYDKIVIYSQKVISEHNTKCKKNSCKIEFSGLLDLIRTDHKSDSNTTDYMYYKLLKLIKETFERYPTSRKTVCENDDCNECQTTTECNLYQQMLEISSRSYSDKKDFLYKLLLRTPKNNLPRDTVINNLFIALLKKLECLKFFDSNVVLAKKNNKIYRLTLDENEDVDDFEDQLKKELSIDNTNKFLIYESDVLITDRLNKEVYTYNQNNFNVIGAQELDELQGLTSDSMELHRKNYNKSKVMRIISKDVAERELINNE